MTVENIEKFQKLKIQFYNGKLEKFTDYYSILSGCTSNIKCVY